MSEGKKPKENRKQRLNDTWIARHKLTLPQEDYFDTGQPGLILRMSYGGAKTFRVRYKDERGKSRTSMLLQVIEHRPPTVFRNCGRSWAGDRVRLA